MGFCASRAGWNSFWFIFCHVLFIAIPGFGSGLDK
jgi:hypothetical protein